MIEKSELIDLRSDTVTKPSDDMREVMRSAEVGDDVFAEDPQVNMLQAELAEQFGQEAGLFCPSGTMANQIAINVHTQPGDQVICSALAHIYHYEGGGMAMNSGVTAKLLHADRGLFKPGQVTSAILPSDIHFPTTRLVCLEDTCNKGGGAIWPYDDLEETGLICRERGLAYHLDGARVFNSLVASGHESTAYGSQFDSISICLSKGLGAPIGSVLLGNRNFIEQATRVRKALGGGMRQAGIIAAAGRFALAHHVERLAIDHQRAKILGEVLQSLDWVEQVLPIDTNIIVFDIREGMLASDIIEALASQGVLAFATGERSIRFVLHLDISEQMLEKCITVCSRLAEL